MCYTPIYSQILRLNLFVLTTIKISLMFVKIIWLQVKLPSFYIVCGIIFTKVVLNELLMNTSHLCYIGLSIFNTEQLMIYFQLFVQSIINVVFWTNIWWLIINIYSASFLFFPHYFIRLNFLSFHRSYWNIHKSSTNLNNACLMGFQYQAILNLN